MTGDPAQAWTSQDTGPVGMGDLINLMLLSAGIISDEALLEAVLRHSAEQFRGAPPASKVPASSLHSISMAPPYPHLHVSRLPSRG